MQGQFPQIRHILQNQIKPAETDAIGKYGAATPGHTPYPRRIQWKHHKVGSECVLKGNMEERAERLALYIIENRATVRDAAKKFGISKSTVHKDIRERLPLVNRSLFLQVQTVLEINKAERHIRGGLATRQKYRGR